MAQRNFDTIRDLERMNSKWFKTAGLIGIAGVILLMFGFGTIVSVVGIAAILVAVVIFFITMLRVIHLSREPHRTIYCPYCASKNEVFMSRTEIACDVCKRGIRIGVNGEPIPTEETDDDDY